MPFQAWNNVNRFMSNGVIGEISDDGPSRVKEAILRSANPGLNVIGRAFTYLDIAPTELNVAVSAGLPATDVNPFAGILGFPKEYPLLGTGAGTLEPTLTLSNNQDVSLMIMGFMWVFMGGEARVGWLVYASNTTSELVAAAPAATPPADHWLVPNCTIWESSIPANGISKIKLTN